jgi:hypothetical protein
MSILGVICIVVDIVCIHENKSLPASYPLLYLGTRTRLTLRWIVSTTNVWQSILELYCADRMTVQWYVSRIAMQATKSDYNFSLENVEHHGGLIRVDLGNLDRCPMFNRFPDWRWSCSATPRLHVHYL